MFARPVTLQHADLILAWRNDTQSRAASRSMESIDEDDHHAWLTDMLARSESSLFIVYNNEDQPVGHVRFVLGTHGYEVSIIIAPEHRGHGHGREALRIAQAAFMANHPDQSIRAYVRTDNSASHQLFITAGYVAIDTDESGTWYLGGCDA